MSFIREMEFTGWDASSDQAPRGASVSGLEDFSSEAGNVASGLRDKGNALNLRRMELAVPPGLAAILGFAHEAVG